MGEVGEVVADREEGQFVPLFAAGIAELKAAGQDDRQRRAGDDAELAQA